MQAVLESHGGNVEKFIGDAIVAVFGIPELHEDDAVRAVRAASSMRDELEALNEELDENWNVRIDARTGVNTGEVLADERSAAIPLTADAANVAARLEQAAAPGEILIGEATYRLVKDAVRVEPAGELELKGKSAPVVSWRLLEVSPTAPGIARRLDSPLVGRDAELRLLLETFERAVQESRCQLVTVVGPPGAGKSRLSAEVARELGEKATVHWGRCLPYGKGITFWPMAEALRQAAGIAEAEDAEAAREKIARLLGDRENVTTIAEHVASAIGLGGTPAPLQETFWALRGLVEALAEAQPLVLVFDDIHWAEPIFLDFLEYLAGWSSGAPIVLLCPSRPDLIETRPTWGSGASNVASVTLPPLQEEESHRLLENLLGSAEIEDEASARIAQASEGNPLFVEELLRMLIDDGLLRRDDGRWRATGDLGSIAIPATIHAILAARLERLSREERAVVQRASVVGKEFWWGAVSHLSPPEERGQVGTQLQALVRKELIRPDVPTFVDEDAFRFSHVLVRDAAYQGVPKQKRADLHERFADWLNTKAGEREAEFEEIIGYHLEQAHRYLGELGPLDVHGSQLAKEAARLLAQAGRRAFQRYDVPATVNLLSRAADLLPPDDRDRLVLLPDLAQTLSEVGDIGRADELLDEALQRSGSDENLRAHISVTRWLSRLGGEDRGESAREEGERAIEVFQRFGDERGLARAWNLIGVGCWRTGQAAEAERALEQAVNHATAADDSREATESHLILGAVLVQGPTPIEEAISRARRIIEGEAGNRTTQAYMLHALAHLHAWQGEFDEGRDAAKGYLAILRENGQEAWLALAAEAPADVEMVAGDADEALRILIQAQERLESMGDPDPEILPFLSDALYVSGRYREAGEKAALAAAGNHPLWRTLGKSVLAKVRAQEGSPEAIDLAREAVSDFERTDFLFHARVLMDLAEVLGLLRREDEAPPILEKAMGLYQQKGALVLVERARVALERLTGGQTPS
jgi:tetratricopeptide (TPR) repeat protein